MLLYCWHAYHHLIPAGIWFACMNYTVHGIMYFYYFLMAAGQYKLASSFAGFVTAMQITQMMVCLSLPTPLALLLCSSPSRDMREICPACILLENLGALTVFSRLIF